MGVKNYKESQRLKKTNFFKMLKKIEFCVGGWMGVKAILRTVLRLLWWSRQTPNFLLFYNRVFAFFTIES